MSSVSEPNTQSAPETQKSWVEESMDRYSNPLAFSRATTKPPEPVVQEEKILASPSGGQSVKLVTALLKERPVWSKVTLVWTFRQADIEGADHSQPVVVMLAFDSWTGAVQISENGVLKVDEIQSPIVGGSWKAKTDFGVVEIKIEPCWTGYQYELWFDGERAYQLFL